MRLYVGTSGWSYPKGKGTWDRVFYPESVANRDKLAFYAQHFNAVELNSSFYRPPSPAAARGWAAKVPSDFRMAAKLWQKFTHPKMFEQATGAPAEVKQEDFDVFVAGLAPLAEVGKLGPIVAQFPPSFKPDSGSVEYLQDLIRRLRGVGFELAVELRHRGWTESEQAHDVRHFMEEEGVAWVMIDEPRFRTSIRDVPLTYEVGYFRFHGRNYQSWWRHDAGEDRYNYFYSPDEMRQLAGEVHEVAEHTRETYAFYNNHYGAKAVVNALQLEMALGQPALRAPLPEPLLKTFTDLEDLLERSRAQASGRKYDPFPRRCRPLAEPPRKLSAKRLVGRLGRRNVGR